MPLSPTCSLPTFGPVGKRDTSNAHRASVYHLASILYVAFNHGWRTTPGAHEIYARPPDSPRTNIISPAAKWVRFNSYLVRCGQAMRVQATITERDYRRALDKLEPGQVELIEAYYRRKPEAALKLESPELPSVPNLSTALPSMPLRRCWRHCSETLSAITSRNDRSLPTEVVTDMNTWV